MSEFSVILTTCASRQDADAIIQPLLERRLVACAQLLDIHSQYSWKGKIQNEPECLILLKAKSSLYSDIEACIKEHHKYETPEVVQLSVERGLEAYLSWIREISK